MSTDKRVTEDLIETLEDGKDGYAQAAEQLADSDRPELSAKMRDYSGQRSSFVTDLERLAARYGDDVDEDGTATAAVHRAWMTLKDSISGSNPDGVLDVAEQGERHAVSEYEKALSKDISAELRLVAQRQLEAIKQAHAEIESLRTSHA